MLILKNGKKVDKRNQKLLLVYETALVFSLTKSTPMVEIYDSV